MTREGFDLRCAYCARREGASYTGRGCPSCGGPFAVHMDLARFARSERIPAVPSLPGIFRYVPLLPVQDREAIVSLGEGGTPLLRAGRLRERLGVGKLWLKDESRNPTGSFKDRMLAIGLTRARELSKTTVVVQSSGNVAAAAAAYAARAGLAAKIFVPRTVPEERLVQIRMYGGEVFRIDHDSPAAVFEVMEEKAREHGWYVASTTGLDNPFTLEGAKTIAYELAEQTSFDLPDWIVVPVGGGGNLGTLWRAFLELKELGLLERLPRMAGVQAEGCAPFVEAIRVGRTPREAAALRWPEIRTLCGPIADDVVFDAHIALPAARESGGTAVAVSDDEALEAETWLARDEGLFVEPSSATTVAALRRLVEAGTVSRDASACCLLTGSGFKDPGSARNLTASG